jgi:hypothetical protein
MPIPDMLINNASGYRVISFLDGNAGYNQFFMAEEDMSNLLEKISAFAPLLRLKKEAEFNWGADQQRAFDDIKKYLSSLLKMS